MKSLPDVALSINQPWGGLIADGVKQIENRTWNTTFRGKFLVHVGKTVDDEAVQDLLTQRHPVTGEAFDHNRDCPVDLRVGGIIAVAEIVDVIRGHRDLSRFDGKIDTSWFVGRYGFVLTNVQPIDFIPCVGARGWFKPDYSLTYKPRPEPKARARAAATAPAALPALDLFGDRHAQEREEQ
jgi:hypothetical protein